MSHTLTMRSGGSGTPCSPPLASIGSDKVQQSLSPGTLVFITEHIGLMATQATKFNKRWIQIA